MRIAVNIEGQEDVTWADWVALAEACERSGVEALFRSDHYVSVGAALHRGASEVWGALDAWGTINALAARTSTLRLGTLVSPVTFRHPSVLARLATTADHVSGGRIELGLGTGWSEVEHRAQGFRFPPMRERMDILAEQLEIVHDGHWGDAPFSFKGTHYELADLDGLPKPIQRPHPPLIMGGAAGPRAAALAARFADEYNTFADTLAEVVAHRERIEAACRDAGREPIPVSVMATALIGADEAGVQRRLDELAEWRGEPVDRDAMPETAIVGTPDEVIDQLRGFARAGVARVFLQHLLHRDIEAVELIGRKIAPALAGA